MGIFIEIYDECQFSSLQQHPTDRNRKKKTITRIDLYVC